MTKVKVKYTFNITRKCFDLILINFTELYLHREIYYVKSKIKFMRQSKLKYNRHNKSIKYDILYDQ